MTARITRRNLIASAALPATAQQPPTPAAIPSTPEEERQAILAQLRLNAETLSKVALPMSTEPAARFKA